MADSGHPSRHGFVQCWRCKVWRRRAETMPLEDRAECTDAVWCARELLGQSSGGIPRGPELNAEVKP